MLTVATFILLLFPVIIINFNKQVMEKYIPGEEVGISLTEDSVVMEETKIKKNLRK